jgi:alpha-tubulin suppressor-like RCC1 family protein
MRLLIGMIALAACYSPPSASDCAVRCEVPDGPCPEGTTCQADGFCHASADEEACTGGPGANLHGLSAGRGFTCGIDSDQQLWCWGANAFGQLGIGSEELRVEVPVQVTAPAVESWREVAAGSAHTCAIDDDAGLWCWGSDADGQLGDGDADDGAITRPQRIAEDGPWEDVVAGEFHTCARKAGQLWCWGASYAGQVGGGVIGSVQRTPIEAVAGATDWTFVDVGFNNTCGIRGGDLYCWGDEAVQANDPPIGPTATPQLVEHPVSGRAWLQVAVGRDFACAIDDNVDLWCWGFNDHLELGIQQGVALTPELVDDELRWMSITAGWHHACALSEGDVLHCWGWSDKGQTGVRTVSRVLDDPIDGAWTEVTTGVFHTCGVRAGEAFCFGDNGDGELGAGVAGDAYEPRQVGGAPVEWTQVSAGQTITCAVAAGGTLFCWGAGDEGVLGTATDVVTPTPIANATLASQVWRQVAVDSTHACAVTTAGALWCWGRGDESQLGGGFTSSNEPVEVAVIDPATEWTEVGVGSRYTCARDNATALWCWGLNDQNRVGDPSNVGSSIDVPFRVGGGSSAMTVGQAHACGITNADGQLYCWGWNRRNAVDDMNTDLGIAPPQSVEVDGTLGVFMAADASSDDVAHTCGITTGGSLYCWGAGDGGRLGTGDAADKTLPALVEQDMWEDVTTGGPMSCGRRAGGELWCWGSGVLGIRGDGTANDALEPARVGSAGGWRDVSAGVGHVCAIDADRALWCWGDDSSLQLGAGLGMSAMPVAVQLPGT